MAPDLSDVKNPQKVMQKLEPEVVEGPLGVPIVKPKGAPDITSKY